MILRIQLRSPFDYPWLCTPVVACIFHWVPYYTTLLPELAPVPFPYLQSRYRSLFCLYPLIHQCSNNNLLASSGGEFSLTLTQKQKLLEKNWKLEKYALIWDRNRKNLSKPKSQQANLKKRIDFLYFCCFVDQCCFCKCHARCSDRIFFYVV